MTLQISEILAKLKEFSGEGSNTKKIEWLRQHDSPTLRMLLKHNFDPNIAYNLPEGDPPFKRNEHKQIDQVETTLYAETRRLNYLWLQQSDEALNDITETQREQLSALEAQQAEKGAELQQMIANYRAAEQEITDAREAIEHAKVRLNKAIENAKRIQKEGQEFNAKVQQLDVYVNNIRQQMLNANAELMRRERPTPSVSRNMPAYKREGAFIELLESLHPDEADVLLAVKSKSLTKKFAINKTIVTGAFPNLLP